MLGKLKNTFGKHNQKFLRLNAMEVLLGDDSKEISTLHTMACSAFNVRIIHLLTYYDIVQFEETPSIGEKQRQIPTVICNGKFLLGDASEICTLRTMACSVF